MWKYACLGNFRPTIRPLAPLDTSAWLVESRVLLQPLHSCFMCQGHFTYTPKPNRNRTEKLKCLKPYERFHICAETERRTENVHEFDFIFFCFGGRISANTTGNFDKICTYTTTCVVYNLVIIKAIDGLSSETIVRLFYEHNTIDYRSCGTIPRATIKTTNLMQWHEKICIVQVFLLSEREISPKYTGIFLHFVHGFGSYVKGLPKTKRCNSVAVTVSVRFRFGFGVYVKQPSVFVRLCSSLSLGPIKG